MKYKYIGDHKISLLGTQYRYGEVVDLPDTPERMGLKASDWIKADLNPAQQDSYKILRRVKSLPTDQAKAIAEFYDDPYSIVRAIDKGEKLAGLDLDEKIVKRISDKFDKYRPEPKKTEEVIEEMMQSAEKTDKGGE